MRNHRLRTTSIAIAATLILLTAGSATVIAQNQSVYAIRDARIYPVSGPMIASGTVVIRDGLIEAVGRGGRGGRGGGTQQRPAQDALEAIFQKPLGLHADRQLATLVSATGKNVEAARKVGIASALVVFRDGIVTGQSVLINTGEENLLVKTPVGLHISPSVPVAGIRPL